MCTVAIAADSMRVAETGCILVQASSNSDPDLGSCSAGSLSVDLADHDWVDERGGQTSEILSLMGIEIE